MSFLDRFKQKEKSHEEIEAERKAKEIEFRMSLDAEEAKAYDDAYKREKLERLKRLGSERGRQEYAPPTPKPSAPSTGQGLRNLAHSMGGLGQALIPNNRCSYQQPVRHHRHARQQGQPTHYVNDGGRLVPVYNRSTGKRKVDRRPKRPQLGNIVLGW